MLNKNNAFSHMQYDHKKKKSKNTCYFAGINAVGFNVAVEAEILPFSKSNVTQTQRRRDRVM